MLLATKFAYFSKVHRSFRFYELNSTQIHPNHILFCCSDLVHLSIIGAECWRNRCPPATTTRVTSEAISSSSIYKRGVFVLVVGASSIGRHICALAQVAFLPVPIWVPIGFLAPCFVLCFPHLAFPKRRSFSQAKARLLTFRMAVKSHLFKITVWRQQKGNVVWRAHELNLLAGVRRF